jgi:outer membrane receptor protein involved in Fe transport
MKGEKPMLGSFFGRSSSATSLIALAIASIPTSPRAGPAGDPGRKRRPRTSLARSTSQPSSDQQIVITGSRIPVPISTRHPRRVGSEQIEQRGYTNLADALEELPAFGVPARPGSATARAARSGRARISSISSARRPAHPDPGQRPPVRDLEHRFDLRSQRRRPGGQVDFNNLPTLLVDRVETVAVGGAPIYGSDAIAGTVNVS